MCENVVQIYKQSVTNSETETVLLIQNKQHNERI